MNWFKNLRVAYKILISCSVFIVMIAAVVLFSIRSMNSVNVSIKDYRESNVIPVIKIGEFEKKLVSARATTLELQLSYTSGNQENALKKFTDTAKSEREENSLLMKAIKERSMTDKEKELTDLFEKKYIEFGKTLGEVFEAIKSQDKIRAENVINTWMSQYNEIILILSQLKKETLEVGANKITTEFDNMKQIMIYMLIILGFSVFAGFLLTRILSRSISKPVKLGLDFARKIAEGDFTERINLDQSDELGMLAKALNEAADNLENTVTEIISSSNNLAQAVEQIASGNQNLSQRTSEQASALEEVAATIEEANSSINQNYENSLQANRMSETSSGVAVTGGELVGDAVQSINEVNSSAKKIGEITTVINEIAFQTNLLALNAAVEAARAGEQGRGFAVVAGEVRNLAQRAGNAAKEIAQLIHDTVTKVENGTEKTYKSGESLKEIIESVKNVARVVSEIAASSNEQKQGMDQIATAISDLDSMTQHNAALVEETAAASEEMANQAQELIGLMSQFKIRDEKTIQKPSHQQVPSKAVTTVKQAASRGNGKVKVSVPGNDGKTADLEKEGFDMF